MKKWTLTDEAKAKIPEWNKRWIDVIRRTTPMSEQDRIDVTAAIRGMYAAAKLDSDDVRIVFVKSPLMAAVVAGAACAWWHDDKLATYDATYAATRAATSAATYDATRDATYAATSVEIYENMIRSAIAVVGSDKFARMCISQSWRIRNGGNQWATWTCFLSFVRDVIGWSHESHKNYIHYEACALKSGPRYMHKKFCIVSDMPTVLEGYDRDGVIVAHCDHGPSHRWADGFAIWHIDGVRVDEQIVMRPETQTIEQIDAEPNEEVRRVRIERFGWPRYIAETNADCLDSRRNDVDGTREALIRLKDGSMRLLCACRSTGRVYAIGVDREVKTCQQAQSWMAGGSSLFSKKKATIIGAT